MNTLIILMTYCKEQRAKSKEYTEKLKILFSVIFVAGSMLYALCPLLHAAFEDLGAGARPIGMASAFTAVADDAHAVYYNPAGLAQVRRGELTAGYGKLFAGLKDQSNLGSGFIGAIQPLKSGRLGTVGAGWVSFSLDGAYREDTMLLSYGKEMLTDGFFLGATGKLLKRTFSSDIYTAVDPLFSNGYNTSNYSFDLGMMYRPSASYSFGLVLKDINQPDVSLDGAGDKVPLEIRGGFGYHQRQLLFDAEVSRKAQDTDVAIGIEKWLFNYFGLRAGFSAGTRDKREIATGMSYKGNYFSLDYAFVFPLAGVESTAGSHRFSVTIRFGKAPEKAKWEFEDEDKVVERLLEEKSAQISAMERELEFLRDQNRSGRLENSWVRQEIKKLEDQLKVQESSDLENMKNKLSESKAETDDMKDKIRELESKIKTMTAPKKEAPAVVTSPPAPKAPETPRTYTVKDGETLQSIAGKVYGIESKWVEIYELNADRVERGGTIRAGQVLLLPQR